MTPKWSVANCFEGPRCWCAIILSPDGQQCNAYGAIAREDCTYIVNALNGEAGTTGDTNDRHPLPWTVKPYGRHVALVDASDSVDTCVCPCGCSTADRLSLFADAVNQWYAT